MDVEDTQKETEEQVVNIGALLCEARDNLALDSEQIAAHLNLSLSIIEKIEQNIFEQDIPIAFIRGYVKSYATKVGLDTPQILADFDSQTGLNSPSLMRVKSISKFDSKSKEMNSSSFIIKVISGLLILLFLSYGGWKLWQQFSAEDTASTVSLSTNSEVQEGQEIELNTQVNTIDTNLNLASSSDSDSDSGPSSNAAGNRTQFEQDATPAGIKEQASETSVVEPPIVTDASENNSINSEERINTSDSSDVQNQEENIAQQQTNNEPLVFTSLVLDFTADCWVKVLDVRGEVLAVGVKIAGKHMPLSGVKPFNVVLGDPSVVTMEYNGQVYDLSRYRAGRRAEIILN